MSPNNETAAMLVTLPDPPGIELRGYYYAPFSLVEKHGCYEWTQEYVLVSEEAARFPSNSFKCS